MITIAFEKKDNAIYVSHTDIIRSLNRTFRRAGIAVNYSKGFNRHMSLKLTQPLPFGVTSREEWVTCDIEKEYNENEILSLFNANCPPSLHAKSAYILKANPNLGGLVIASDYMIYSEKAFALKDEILLAFKTLEITTNKDGEIITKSVADLIYKAKVTKEGIYLLLAFGNKNLRIDLVAKRLNELFNLDIENTDLVRLHQYVGKGGDIILAEEYIKSLL